MSAHFWKAGSRGRSGESHGSKGEAEGLMPTEGLWVRSEQTAGTGRAELHMECGAGNWWRLHESTVPVGSGVATPRWLLQETSSAHGEFGSAHQALWRVSMEYRTENMGNKWKP